MFGSASPLFLLMSLGLLAQAGGGGSYGGGSSGSGGGGSGSSGGGGGDGELIGLLIEFTFRYPQFGIPMWIVIGIFVYFSKTAEKNARVTRTIRRGRKVQEESLHDSAIRQIQERDPDFDEAVFQQRVVNGFVKTQYAWSEQDLRPCRAFISDGVRERFELYIAMQKAENIRNRMKDVEVEDYQIVTVTSDQHFDTIHVRISASAISYNEDLDTAKRVSGNSDRTRTKFTEIWSFSRRPGAKTNSMISVLQGRCPNCGGPMEIVDTAKCPQCQSVVNSGQYDWVLSEITQVEEWVVPPVHHSVPDWDKLQQTDPGLNFQHIEDRASVMFWRCLMAVYFDDVNYAAPIIDRQSPGVPKLWSREADGFWKTPAVGVVEIVRCVPAGEDKFDRILVLIRWSATKASGNRQKPELQGVQRIYSHVLKLKRGKGIQSTSDNAFASFSCNNCGASIDLGKSDACNYCDSPLNDGSGDWVLEGVAPYHMLESFSSNAQQQRSLEQHGGENRLEADRLIYEPELLTALTRVLMVDGELHENERRYITELAESRGIPTPRMMMIMATATSNDVPIDVPQNREQSKTFMDHLLRATLIDGKIKRTEYALLQQAGQQIGWSTADLKLGIVRIRTELYQQAKKSIRNRRRK
ncbi:MAG: TIM44-like domain-containing protein [Planctomycetales bacterium]|jgi:hypothetical protein